MKRKLIQQGNGGFTISLPKKWIKLNKLEKGDELSFEIFPKQIHLLNLENKKLTTNIEINSKKEVIFRIILANTYRLGFEKIILKTKYFNLSQIENFVNQYFIGFETYEIEKNIYEIKEIIKPSKENNLDQIIQEYLYLYKTLYNNLFENDISNLVYKIQKYDNLIRRIISKDKINKQSNFYFWNFLTHFLFSARETLHLQNKSKKLQKNEKHIIKEKLKGINKTLIDFFNENTDKESFEKTIELCQEFLKYLDENKKIKKEISHSIYTLVKHLYLLTNIIQGYKISLE